LMIIAMVLLERMVKEKHGRKFFCKNSSQKGIIVLGDSAAAHFSIPINQLNTTTPLQWATLAENEADYPGCSWATGFWNTTDCPIPQRRNGMDSIYKRMFLRNRCNHRDYQNIAVDGARSPSMNHTTVFSMARDQNNDVPAIVFYAMVGNDVCNPHYGGSSMTSPEEFEANVVSTLQYLDTVLPNGSTVFLLGLQNGTIIWDTMNKRIHPLQVTYGALWEFVDCLGINPCWGWLNPDPYWRNFTEVRAEQLNNVFPKIVKERKFKHFDIHYLGSMLKPAYEKLIAEGGDPALLFGETDGGHPSQIQHELTAEILWDILVKQYPNVIGKENPFNDQIVKLFGDQGGY